MTTTEKLVVLVGVIVGCMLAGHRLDMWHLMIAVPMRELPAIRTGTDDE